MPLFDFKCINCHTVFEFLANHGDYGEDGKLIGLKCPHCHTTNPDNFIKQFPKKTNFDLVGDGWAKDGYSSTKDKK